MTREGVVRLTPQTLLAGLIGGAALSSGVALTATSGWLIVRASERPVILTLLTAIVAVRTFGLARPVFRYWERLRSHDAALGELATRRASTYRRLVPLTPARLGARSRTDLLTGVVDDLTEVVESQARVTVPLLSTAVTGLVAVALAAVLCPPVGLVVAGLVLVVAGIAWLAHRLESDSQTELLTARADVARVSQLVAGQAAELQAIRAEEAALRWVAEAHRTMHRAVRRQSRGRAWAAALLPLATVAATVVAAVVVARDPVVSPAVGALLVLTPFALLDVLAPLPEAMRALARAEASDRRLEGVLDQRPAVAADSATTPTAPVAVPHLRLSGVTASWDGTRRAVGPVDLDLPPGSTLALTGANGCGKSTVLAVLARHLDPAGGRYEVDGVDATQLDLERVRSLFAVVDDEPHVFATSVRENVRLARPGADDTAVLAALRAAGLGDWSDQLADGLDTRLGTGGTGVSGGERVRLAIARALLSGRPVLLLDEPVAHLDHATATAVLADLFAALGPRSAVLVGHRPEGLDQVGRIMDLSSNQIGDRSRAAAHDRNSPVAAPVGAGRTSTW